jgi:hypothetical protein
MGRHVDPEALTAFVEGRASDAIADAVRVGIEACAHCRRRRDDYAAVRRALTRGFGPEEEPMNIAETASPYSPAADRAFDEIVRRGALAGAAASSRAAPQRSTYRRFGPWAAAVAASILLVLLVPGDAAPTAAPTFGLRGVVAYAEDGALVRAARDRTYHFEVALDRSAYVVVVRVLDGLADVVYPDPNPSLATFGVKGPLPAGTTTRIPPSPALDWTLRADDLAPEFTAIPFASPPDAASIAEVGSVARRAVGGGIDAVRAALESRFGTASRLAPR